MEKYACMRKEVHVFLRIMSTAVVEEHYACLVELTFDCLFFLLQLREDSRVSRQPLLVLVLVLVLALLLRFVSQCST